MNKEIKDTLEGCQTFFELVHRSPNEDTINMRDLKMLTGVVATKVNVCLLKNKWKESNESSKK